MMNIDERRKHGVFYTPKIWADYAHERLSKELGENWKNEFVVWDNCAGTCNLTKDYKFNELYISTLFESEVEEGMQYNPEAEHFQFDFLNDDIPNPGSLFNTETKIPDRLLDAFEKNKKILFLINPPYASAGNFGETSKAGVAVSKINKQMIKDGYGKSAQNLYTQFLYRIEKLKQAYKLTDCYIGIFCPTLFMTGTSFDKFREYFLDDFEYVDGFQFQASHFADVASNWGIGFTIWKSGKSLDKENFEIDICDVDKKSYTGDIENKGQKCIYNTDKLESCSTWIKTQIKGTNIVPTFSSGLKMNNKDGIKVSNKYLGTLMLTTNTVDTNTTGVAIFSSLAKIGASRVVSIERDNFNKAVTLFAARRLVSKNWINWTDEYLAPDESNPKFKEFTNDSVIFSLFESKSQQSSLRNVDYKDSQWDIKNEFFWMSKNEIADLADKNNNEDCYDDAITSTDRFVYKYLQRITLSPEAQAVLDYANNLVRDSFKYRDMFDSDFPDYQINNWDCGYYQLKFMWQEYMPEEFKQFRALYAKLADKMRPMVYELGFLKK